MLRSATAFLSPTLVLLGISKQHAESEGYVSKTFPPDKFHLGLFLLSYKKTTRHPKFTLVTLNYQL